MAKLFCDRDYTFSERIGGAKKWTKYTYRTILLEEGTREDHVVFCRTSEIFYQLMDQFNGTDLYRKYYSL